MPLSTMLLATWIGATPYVLVLNDGRAVRVQKVPEKSGELLLVTLADGTFVSLPETQVDWSATAKVNDLAARPVDADPNASDLEPEQSDPLAGRKVRERVITNETIDTFNVANPTAPLPQATGAAAVTEERGPARPLPPAVTRIQLDDEGRGPEYWRERARAVRDRISAAESAEKAARRSLAAERQVLHRGRRVSSPDHTFEVTEYIQSDEERAVVMLRISELEESWRIAAAEVDLARKAGVDLREEARRAGALPGWLRLPVAY